MNFPGPDQLGVLIPIVALMIPIVRILTKHQLQMAEIMQRNAAQQGQSSPEVDRLRYDVMELKQLMHDQAIAVDNLRNMVARPQEVPIQTRLEGQTTQS